MADMSKELTIEEPPAGEPSADQPGKPEPKILDAGDLARMSASIVAKGMRNWTAADARTLMITVLGGLAVNVLTVIVLAIAVLMARLFSTNDPTVAKVGVAFMLLPIIPVLAVVPFRRRLSRGTAIRVFTIAMAMAGLYLTLMVLAFVGAALGIK
jgi:hypothetical protein